MSRKSSRQDRKNMFDKFTFDDLFRQPVVVSKAVILVKYYT